MAGKQVGVYGSVGSGKTIFAVEIAKSNPDIKIFTNFTLKVPNARRIEPDELLDIEESKEATQEENLFILDEGYTWIESRLSLTKLNRFSSYAFFQSRKTRSDYLILAQLRGSLDVRFRLLETYSIYAYERREKNRKGKPNKAGFYYNYIKGFRSIPFKIPYKKAEKLFPLFNTYERIQPPDIAELKADLRTQNPEKLNLTIDSIITTFQMRKFDLSTITHDIVRDYLLRIAMPFAYEPFVYVRLKAQTKKQGVYKQ